MVNKYTISSVVQPLSYLEASYADQSQKEGFSANPTIDCVHSFALFKNRSNCLGLFIFLQPFELWIFTSLCPEALLDKLTQSLYVWICPM